MTDKYAWWRKALEMANGGELSRDQLKSIGVSEGDPQAGFYRKRKFKDGPFIPVAIWESDSEWLAYSGNDALDANDAWLWCCRNPISEDAYHAAVRGEAWADEPPPAPIGHNQPSDPLDALRIEFEGERELAEQFLKTPVTTQEQADKAAVWAKRLATIAKKAGAQHKVEKQPHLDAGRAVDDKWRDLKEAPDLLSKRLKRHLDDWLREQDRLERECQAKAREEADQLRRAAEEQAKQAAGDAQAEAEAERLAKEAYDREREAVARNAQAGRTGARVALRTFVSAEITDYDALLAALKDRPEIKEVVQSLANRAAKAGRELPGMKVTEERRAT